MARTADVLIVGGGASGLAASMLLSSYGISTYLVSKYPTTSHLPKASALSLKTMEIFRELGIDTEIERLGTPQVNKRYCGYYAGFAGDGPDYGRAIVRLGSWGRGGLDLDWAAASAVNTANLVQSRLEPIMRARAEGLAPGCVAFNHNFLGFTQNDTGVTATIEDRASGEHYEVQAKYLLACDGGRVINPQIDVTLEGELAVATSISIHFSADLSAWFHDDEALIHTVFNPDVGVPFVLLPSGPEIWGAHSTEWIGHLVSFKGDHKQMDDEAAVAMMKRCLGLPDLDPKVHVINRWPLDAVVASKFRVGRVFILGDAAHRMPPSGGHGLNTAVQDAYNLCWKLAAVLRGEAGPALLDTYEAERRPVAQHIVATAFEGWHRNRDLAMAIGFSPVNTPEQNWANIREVWAEGAAGDAARRRLARSLPGILPNFNSLNVGFSYTYDHGAVVPDGSPISASPDPLGIFHASTRPGHSLPHAWVENLLGRCSVGDLVSGRFVLIAGEEGSAWRDAAHKLAEARGVKLDAFTVGTTEGDWLDIRHGWDQVREHGPGGAVLVRPDRFIAWRAMDNVADPVSALSAVFDQLLCVNA